MCGRSPTNRAASTSPVRAVGEHGGRHAPGRRCRMMSRLVALDGGDDGLLAGLPVDADEPQVVAVLVGCRPAGPSRRRSPAAAARPSGAPAPPTRRRNRLSPVSASTAENSLGAVVGERTSRRPPGRRGRPGQSPRGSGCSRCTVVSPVATSTRKRSKNIGRRFIADEHGARAPDRTGSTPTTRDPGGQGGQVDGRRWSGRRRGRRGGGASPRCRRCPAGRAASAGRRSSE